MKQNYDSLIKRIQQFSITCEVKDENGVVHHFHHGHEYVEIGGLKWATMNVGATAVTDNGLYFQWGGSKGHSIDQVINGENFDLASHEHGGGSMPKYNNYDGKTTLDADDDGVAVNWGGKWRMPTSGEIKTLGDAVNSAWTNEYKSAGVKGMVCTAKDGSGGELFFPAAGYCYNGMMSGVGSYAFYWSSSLVSSNVYRAYNLYFDNGCVNWQNNGLRYFMRSLRGVVGE